jgi:hypothetical protein
VVFWCAEGREEEEREEEEGEEEQESIGRPFSS